MSTRAEALLEARTGANMAMAMELDPEIANDRRMLDAFRNLPLAVWSLPIRWNRRVALALFVCLYPHVVSRTLRAQQRAARDIASHLRAASRTLRSHPEADFYLAGVLHLTLGHRWIQRGAPRELGPRLSALLRAVAEKYHGTGGAFGDLYLKANDMLVGQPGRYQTRRELTIAESALRLLKFFMRHTGKPHIELTREVLQKYYDTIPERVDLESLARQRRRTETKTGRSRQK